MLDLLKVCVDNPQVCISEERSLYYRTVKTETRFPLDFVESFYLARNAANGHGGGVRSGPLLCFIVIPIIGFISMLMH